MWGAWPLALASTPGGYLGAAVLLFVPFALRDAARRYLVVALGAVAVLAYLLTNTVLVGAGWFRSLALSLPFGDVYLHNPSRLRYLAFLIVPALGAVGIQWFLDHRPGFGEAMRWIGAGLVVFLVFPLVMGARPGRLVIFAVASIAVVGVVWAFARGRRWAPVALCAILAAELLSRRDLVVHVPRRHRLPRPGDREPRRAGRRAAPLARRRRPRVPLPRPDRPRRSSGRDAPTGATSPGSGPTRTSTRATCSPGRSRTGPRC